MKRTVVVLALMCALVLAVGLSSASAGLLPVPPPSGTQQSASQDQDVKNETDQSNKAFVVSVPILSGNNVALINGGDQTASADTTTNQGNFNGTDQTAVQAADQEQQAASGTPEGSWKTSDGQSSSGASQRTDQDQDVKNETDQSNKAAVIAVPIASGNNIALINTGDQNASADTTANQGNFNGTDQTAVQAADQDQAASGAQSGYGKSDGGQSGSGASQRTDQDQDVKNETDQSNKAFVISAPIASGNNVALFNGGDQNASADTTVNQGNFNGTEQKAIQVADQDQNAQSQGGASQRGSQDQDVKNETDQSNKAFVVAVPIASGNNIALINGGDQNASADTTVNQGNFNWTDQKAVQVADQNQHGGSAPVKGTPSRYDGNGKGEQGSGQSQRLDQDQDVKNETDQRNKAAVIAVPILSGNNVGLINGGGGGDCHCTGVKHSVIDDGGQTASADTTVNQGNFNWTDQKAIQVAKQEQYGSPSKGTPSRYDGKGKSECRCKPDEQHSAGQSQRLDQDQDVKNETYQSNKAFVVAVPILSGNNVGLINGGGGGMCRCTEGKYSVIDGGGQTASADTTVNQGNFNWTHQKAVQVAEQEQKSWSAPSKGKNGCGCDSTPHSNGPSSYEGKRECGCNNEHSNGQSQRLYQDQDVKNETYQRNKAFVASVPILSGNNVGLINGGGGGMCRCTDGKYSVIDGGGQTASADTTVNQGNFNWTDQKAIQVAKQEQYGSPSKGKNGCGCYSKPQPSGKSQYDGKVKSECRCKPDEQHSAGQSQWLDQDQDVKNETYQSNKAFVVAVPILSGNNLALFNGGNQTASADTTVNQGNFNWTRQWAFQGGFQQQGTNLRR